MKPTHFKSVAVALIALLALALKAQTQVPALANHLAPGSYQNITPKRFTVAAYLNCGPKQKVATNGVTIECLNGTGENSLSGVDPALSYHSAAGALRYKVSGLDTNTDYILGFTWWDAGLLGRRQTLSINGGQVLAEAAAVAYDEKAESPGPAASTRGRPTPARIQFALLPGQVQPGGCDIRIESAGPGSAVNSELWVLRRTQPRAEKQVLLVSGQDYPGHHWRQTQPVLERLITADPRLEVTICESPYAVGLSHLNYYDAVFLHFKNYEADLHSTKPMRENLSRYVSEGGGLCLSHFACGAFEEWPEFVEIAGRVWNHKAHDNLGAFTVKIRVPEHPVTQDLTDFQTVDELYFCLGGAPHINVLCDAFSQKMQADHPQAFAYTPGRGRVFLSTLGHNVQAYDAEGVRHLYRQGTAWAAGLKPLSPERPPSQPTPTRSQ